MWGGQARRGSAGRLGRYRTRTDGMYLPTYLCTLCVGTGIHHLHSARATKDVRSESCKLATGSRRSHRNQEAPNFRHFQAKFRKMIYPRKNNSISFSNDLIIFKKAKLTTTMQLSATLLVLFAGSAAAFAPLAVTKARQQSSLPAVLGGETGRSQLDPTVIDRYNALPYPTDQVLAEYVWVDADGATRSKTRTLHPSKVRHCCS
jgi:hypothetical protein